MTRHCTSTPREAFRDILRDHGRRDRVGGSVRPVYVQGRWMRGMRPQRGTSGLMDLLVRASSVAGEILLARYRDDPMTSDAKMTDRALGATLKDRADTRTISTRTERKAESLIIATLRAHLECDVLCEERGFVPSRRKAGCRAIVDPLDGSRNYVDGTFGLFGVSIAVERGVQLEAGAIALPYYGLVLLAEANKGAYLFRRKKRSMTMELRRLGFVRPGTGGKSLRQARVCIGRGAAPASVMRRRPLSEVVGRCGEAVNFGSCTVGLAGVILGKIDGLILPKQSYWDFAAGRCILSELGMSFGVWNEGWRKRVAARELTRASAEDKYNIAAARTGKLFREMTRILET
jgi:fructose-1,6-bisphosphatase/inositol monophosphatase family enzyme